jgi:L-seryl-tRNA(Ser) seleniumtransferase
MAETRSSERLRALPQVDQLLREIPGLDRVGPEVARWIVRKELEGARARTVKGDDPGDVRAAIKRRVDTLLASTLRRVVNATGVILHTNLGRAPLSRAAVDAIGRAAGAVNLELDLSSGERGARAPLASTLVAALTGAEDALIVNNNAAALMLALAALARGREAIVSRGELIEIGGEFRLPELMEASGAVLREVGTTNRTHARDYRSAISERAALILKVHPSNYQIVGFTAAPSLDDLVAIAHEAGLPLLYDVGSGLLAPERGALEDEPDARSAIEAGCDLVCFSGDKLLGGPQAGILVGRRGVVERCRRHPIARAVRADKLSLAALEATLWAHALGRRDEVPAWGSISLDTGSIRRRAETLASHVGASVIDGESVTGGGSLPERAIPTALIAIDHRRPEALAASLRDGEPPIVARVERGRVVLDLRTVQPEDDGVIEEALRRAL